MALAINAVNNDGMDVRSAATSNDTKIFKFIASLIVEIFKIRLSVR